MIDNISVVIIAKDAEETISETLNSLKLFNEVIVYLNNSLDSTKTICQKYQNVNVYEGDFLGFGKTKNHAASFATNYWILSLDSDEVLNDSLINELEKLDLSDQKFVVKIKRDNYFLNKKIKYSGWGNDYLVRLYNKKRYHFSNDLVHESIKIDKLAQVKILRNSFKHNAVTNVNQFLYKAIKYSDLASQNKKTCSFTLVILKAIWAFIKSYILKLGFLEGWRGLVIAISNFNGKFYRYTKRYINCKEK